MQPTHIIRKAHPTDLPFIYSGELDYIRNIEPEQEAGWKNAIPAHLRQWTSNLDRMFVVEHEGKVVGYCFWQTDDQKAVLASIYVATEQRRHGLGTRLFDKFVEDASAHGHTHLIVNVHINNPARALYEAAGFQRVRERADYLDYEYIRAQDQAV
ncbi:GNAT family N-acetyltransferase [Paraburkholderia megapolitana]|uniref:GNAT family N-acetyltransferase n=1 Tax=Paraburkholderia megapolitana TaxID=420953 RepID=UPI0038B77CAC